MHKYIISIYFAIKLNLNNFKEICWRNMDLLEYQAKELFSCCRIPISKGYLVNSCEEAKLVASEIGKPVMFKAQVKASGRGKIGGVKYVSSPEKAFLCAKNIFEMNIKGYAVEKILVEEAYEIIEEYYVSFLLDRTNRCYTFICSTEGGIRVEEIIKNSKGKKLTRIPIDILKGVNFEIAYSLTKASDLPTDMYNSVAKIIQSLWQVLVDNDATLVEVNPLARTKDNQVLALDGKITLDSNAKFRQPKQLDFENEHKANYLEIKAKKSNLNYVKLDGTVGIIGNGAGLVMSTLDIVTYAGKMYNGIKPANFLDIGGGASSITVTNGLNIVLNDSQVKSVFVNIFGGITSCDFVAYGIIKAMDIFGNKLNKPVVIRLEGNNAVEGRQILNCTYNKLLIQVETMEAGAYKTTQLANKG